MVTEAKRLAEQADTLNDAIEVLDGACHLDPKIREQYSEMLSLVEERDRPLNDDIVKLSQQDRSACTNCQSAGFIAFVVPI